LEAPNFKGLIMVKKKAISQKIQVSVVVKEFLKYQATKGRAKKFLNSQASGACES
jgi:hypothetical protein